MAFTVAYTQNKQLIGEKGLMPCKDYLRSVKRYVGGKIGFAALAYTPSVLWFMAGVTWMPTWMASLWREWLCQGLF